MKRIGILLVVLPLVLLVGCDDDSTPATTAQTPVTIDSGAMTVGAGSTEKLSEFNIGEPGQVEVTVTWSAGPANLTLIMEAMGGAMAANVGGSPVVTVMDVSQALLDTSNVILAGVINNDTINDAQIQFTIIFTPDS